MCLFSVLIDLPTPCSSTGFPARVTFLNDAELKADPAGSSPCRAAPGCPSSSLASPFATTPQLWFLSPARLQFQIPGRCSGFPRDPRGDLETKRRPCLICLKSPLRSAGRRDHPSEVSTVWSCCGGGPPLCVGAQGKGSSLQKPKITHLLRTLSGLTLETIGLSRSTGEFQYCPSDP